MPTVTTHGNCYMKFEILLFPARPVFLSAIEYYLHNKLLSVNYATNIYIYIYIIFFLYFQYVYDLYTCIHNV